MFFFIPLLGEVRNVSTFAQIPIVDSLLQVLNTAPNDTTLIKTLNTLAWELRYNKPDTAILLSTQALDIINNAEHSGVNDSEANDLMTFFKKATSQSHHNLGEFNRRIGNYSLALDHNFKALKIREDLVGKQNTPAFASTSAKAMADKKAMAATIGNIGNVYVNQGDYPKALEYYFKALKIDEELGNKKGIIP